MKILIAVDMEGISGVVHWDDVEPGHPEYTRFRRIMTADVNAAIRGAIEAGAEEIVVTDGHGYGRNLLAEELDPRVRLNRGSSAMPLAMVEGVEKGVDGVLFVGYHARGGAPYAILDHTWAPERVIEIRLNGVVVGETGLNAALCGHFGAPVVMLSGDQTTCDEATALLGDVETAVVKVATGKMSAECLPLEDAQQLIVQAAFRGVSRLREGQAPLPFRPAPPITLSIEFVEVQMVERALLLPGAQRVGDRRVEYTADDMVTIQQALLCMLRLSRP